MDKENNLQAIYNLIGDLLDDLSMALESERKQTFKFGDMSYTRGLAEGKIHIIECVFKRLQKLEGKA